MSAADFLDDLLAESDEDRQWEKLSSFVVGSTDEALRAGRAAIDDPVGPRRALAADILGQVATVDATAAPSIARELLARLDGEADPDVLNSLVVALGHAADRIALQPVLRLADHPHEDVRFAVAFALPLVDLDIGEETLAALRTLSADPDADVRNWATFGVAGSDARDEVTVAALAARIDDPDEDTRAEGIGGLARRQDPRAESLLAREFARQREGTRLEQVLRMMDVLD
jgi:HEAT repeat protein